MEALVSCPTLALLHPLATVCQEAAAATPVPPARKLDGRPVLSERSIFARVVFHHFTKRKFCASYREEEFRSCCQASQRPCSMPTLTSR